MDELTEHALEGGRQTDGVVRVGETVRRPLHARSAYVQSVLEHLASVGFDGAPRLLGVDEQGREVFTYVAGEVLVGSPARLSDARVESAARLVRRFHDATAGTPLAGGQEVVCHGDLGPHNIVFDADVAVGIIDWDAGVGPGRRLVDFGPGSPTRRRHTSARARRPRRPRSREGGRHLRGDDGVDGAQRPGAEGRPLTDAEFGRTFSTELRSVAYRALR